MGVVARLTGGGTTTKLRVTSAAAAWFSSPAWEARIEILPVPSKATVPTVCDPRKAVADAFPSIVTWGAELYPVPAEVTSIETTFPPKIFASACAPPDTVTVGAVL